MEGHVTESAIETVAGDAEPQGDAQLDALLRDLQGWSDTMLVGAGLARFDAARLDAIQHGAEVQAERCMRGLVATRRVLSLVTQQLDGREQAQVAHDVSAHLQQQADALESWKALASHAAYIRKHPEVAPDLARRYARQATLQREWPGD